MQDDKDALSGPLLRLPLFPLPAVLVPGLVMPLVLFEPKYLQLAENLSELEGSEQFFGIVKSIPNLAGAGEISINTTGTIAQVQSLELQADGKWDMVVVGGRRFRILELHQDMPYLTADIELLPDDDLNQPVTTQVIEATLEAFDNYRTLLGVSIEENGNLPDDPQTLSYLITAAAMFSLEERQLLLELVSTNQRLKRIKQILDREVALLAKLRCFPTFEPDYKISLN
jgi:Lon protease-like protein